MTCFLSILQRRALALTVALAACSILPPTPPAPTRYDLGPARAPVSQGGSPLQRIECSAPEWLSGTDLHYRLDYQSPLQPQAYRDGRWAAPPCALLAHQLRSALSAAGDTTASGSRATLRLAVEEFGQDFDSAETSHVILRVNGTLDSGEPHSSTRQRVFLIQLPASPDAAGGVRALAAASGELAAQLQAWIAQP